MECKILKEAMRRIDEKEKYFDEELAEEFGLDYTIIDDFIAESEKEERERLKKGSGGNYDIE